MKNSQMQTFFTCVSIYNLFNVKYFLAGLYQGLSVFFSYTSFYLPPPFPHLTYLLEYLIFHTYWSFKWNTQLPTNRVSKSYQSGHICSLRIKVVFNKKLKICHQISAWRGIFHDSKYIANKRFKTTSPKSFLCWNRLMFFTSFYERKICDSVYIKTESSVFITN